MACIMKWMTKHPPFVERYVRARDFRAHARFERVDQVIQEAREGKIDPHVARLEIDTIKWMCGKENAKRYGDRIELAGDKDNPLTLSIAEVLRQREQLSSSQATVIDVDSTPVTQAPKLLK